ncbi:FG-GAP-like repeat-containing protein [Hymenobacter ruricola]|uniref:VCBS repeat-containing protein n=1 Tax=Hymenobacter ruricola TaxID=2791023 RepID=A0ABS0I5Z2_9BACT|nr:FG-GAP-like repeat-containing protein [Hymenobacter ruricola]MBF9222361.1 VCBS repeat-containing protein [Hymenobacter ruricola]
MLHVFRHLPGCRPRPATYRPLAGLLAALLLPAAVAAQAPTISSLSPGSGPLGTTVTLAGSNLGGATSVLVGGVPAAFAPGSAAQLTFTVPRQAVSQRVRVSSAGGTGLSAATFQVTRPSASTVLPAQGNVLTNTLSVVSDAAPAVTDVDGDGLLDLLVGTYYGNVVRYEQTAANATTFTLLGNLTTNGTTALSVVTGAAAPAVTDVDGDGLLDLLVGNYQGNVVRYEQTATNGAVFAQVRYLTTDSTTDLDVSYFATPTVTDVDGDGRLDLLVGNDAGTVVRYEQTATNGGVFALVGNLTTDGTTALDVGYFAAPTVTDVDGDGRLDLLVGNIDGTVQCYEQTATNGAVFAQVGDLVTNGSNPLGHASPAVTDLDGDGRLDLLVGYNEGSVQRYEQTAANGATFAPLSRLTTDPATALNDNAASAVTDLDGDGLLDLLVVHAYSDYNTGDRSYVRRYEQTAANGVVFALVGTLTTDGTTVLESGASAAPTVTDVDGDGLLDLLVGESHGNVQRFEQTAANGDTFTSRGLVTYNGNIGLDVGASATPTVTDLDGDGLLDLLVGNTAGNVRRYEQTAANGAVFAVVGNLTTDGTTTLDAGASAAPTVTDLDGDGLLDLLVGNDAGNVLRFEQTATNGAVFAPMGNLTTDGVTAVAANTAALPTVTDLDGDGILDLLLNNAAGNVLRYEQLPPPVITGISPASGPLGTTLTLTGTNLTGLSSVLVGGVPAAFTPQSATQATAVVPRQAVSQRVRVSNAIGMGLSAAAFQVTRPSPSLVLPALGNLTTDGTAALNAGTYAALAVTDLDGDGLLDLLVGNNPGRVLRYEQTAANGGVFALVGNLTTDGSTALDVGQFATPTVTDVDGDGLLDLLVGNIDGNVLRYEQTAANGGVFAPVGNLTTDGTTTLNVGTYSAPTVTDVDGDGLLDLLVGNNPGTVLRYEQTAANGGVFAPVGSLTTNGSTAVKVIQYSRPTVSDLDGDGLLDLLVGDAQGDMWRYEQTAAGGDMFAGQGYLTTNGSAPLNVGTFAAPAVTDVDGDGLLDLLVGNEYGNGLRYEQAPVPTLTALSRAAELPGQAVTLTGTGFVAGSTVRFGGVAAASVSYVSATQLTAVVPVGATPGSSVLTVGSYDVSSAAGSSPAFEVLQVYRTATASGCLATASLTVSGTGGAGVWRYLRLPGTGGAVVAAIEDTRNLGTVTAGVLALGTGTSSAVRADGRANRRYLDRNFYLTATNASFTGQTVRVRLYGLTSELARLTAADPAATAATLNASQYDGANVNCALADNSPAGQRRLLPAPATVLSGADWFTAELAVADHFSEFYLTGASTPLPVELTQFTAVAAGPAAVRLAWATATEKNSAAFEVERSLNGETFAPIGTVAAASSSTSARAYGLVDGKLPTDAALFYYRLKQVDADGAFSYSPVRTVALTGLAAGHSLFPNPARGGAATLTGAAPGTRVTVYDALGRPVATATADAAGTAALALPAAQPAGVYVVHAGSQAIRLVVE